MSPESAPAAPPRETPPGRHFTVGTGVIFGNPFLEMLLARPRRGGWGLRLVRYAGDRPGQVRLALTLGAFYLLFVILVVAPLGLNWKGGWLESGSIGLVLFIPWLILGALGSLLGLVMPILAAIAVVVERGRNRLPLAAITLLTPRQILFGLLLSRTLYGWVAALLILPGMTGSIATLVLVFSEMERSSSLTLALLLPTIAIGAALFFINLVVSTFAALIASVHCRSLIAALIWTFASMVGIWIIRVIPYWIFSGFALLGSMALGSERMFSGMILLAVTTLGELVGALIAALPVWLLWRWTERQFGEHPERFLP